MPHAPIFTAAPRPGAMRALLAGLCALLAACAGTPPAPQGPLPVAQPGSSFAIGRSKSLDGTNHLSQHLDDARNIAYFQNFGGGGVGLGLLGPLGVAANISMIESTTKADVERLRGKLALDPLAAFAQAAREAGVATAPAGGAGVPLATPYVSVVKTTPQTLAVAAALIVEPPGQPPAWTHRYVVQLPGSHSLEALAGADAARDARLQRELAGAYRAVLQLVRQESAERIAREPKVTAKSPFLSPRFEFEVAAGLAQREGGWVWLRTPWGVTAVPEAEVTLVPQK